MKKLNLFFIKKNCYECIVTTAEEIQTPCERKVTVELEPARPWQEGKLRGGFGSIPINTSTVSLYSDKEYYFINTNTWGLDGNISILYMAIQKEIVESGKEYRTKDLSRSLNDSAVAFLLPKEAKIVLQS